MKRKLALMLTMTLLAGSLDSGMLVSAADFSAEESVEQAVEEELQPTEENGAEELPSDETNVSEAELVDDPGEDGSEMTESGVDEADISTEPETEPELEEEAEPEEDTELEEDTERLAEDFESGDAEEVEEAQLEDGSEDALSGGADNAGFEWNGLRCISNEKGEVTIKAVINDDHYDKNNNKIKSDRCAYVNGNIPSSINGKPVVRIDTGAFSDCINMTSLNIPDSVKEIGRGAFSGCTSLSSIRIPDNGVVVEAGAFERCTSLTRIHIPASMVTHGYVGESPAYPGIFAGDAGLTTVTFGKGITKIAKGLFLQCSGVRKIVVPDTVKNIEAYAFRSCSALTEVILPEGLENIYNGAFSYSERLTSVKLPSTLKFLDVGAFGDCTGLTTINIPPKMKTHDTTAANRQWPGPFYGCKNLKNVTLDNGMEEVPRGIFYAPSGDIGLEEIVIPDSVKWIGYSAFFGCKNLKKVTLSKKLEGIDSEAFQNCKNMKLSERDLPKTLKTIRDNVFANCTSLENVVLPDSLEYLGISVFYNCQSLTEVNIPAGVETNGATGNYYDMGGPFADCVNLKKVTFGKGIKKIAQGLFYRCTGIESIEIPSTVTEVDYIAFGRCVNLQKVVINSGLKVLWKEAFYKCEKLENLTLPSSVEDIKEYVFKDCKSLKWVMIPPSVKSMAWYNDITYLDEDKIFVNVSSDFAIKGSTGSFAEAYAKKFSIPFVSVGVTEKTTFKITFDKNAKDAKLASKYKKKTVTNKCAYGKLPTPSRKNYYFLGWYTTPKEGGKRVTAGTKVNLKRDQKLYAHWAKADLTKAKISVGNCTWNGKPKTPKVTVKFYGQTLKEKTHYTVSYPSKKNIEPGKVIVTIKGKGVFAKSKSKKASFNIVKAKQTIKTKNVIFNVTETGKTKNLSVSARENPKISLSSDFSGITIVKGKKQVTLKKPGVATITVRAAETKHYKAASQKMKVVLQGRQNIKLVSKALKNDGKNSYTISSDNFNQPIKISVLGGAKYSCAVSNSGKTAAWYESGKGLMVRGQGKVVVTVTTKTSADQVYLASKRVFTINLTGKVQNSDWVFKQDSDGKVILMKYTGKAVNVTVPTTITIGMKMVRVKGLGDSVFEGQKIQKVVIAEEGVLTIGKKAFKNCTALKSVSLNRKTVSIGAEAFSGCKSLTSIDLPDGLKEISASLMKGCSSLSGSVYISKNAKKIGSSAFDGCAKIRTVMVYSNVTSVEANAFRGCNNINKVYYAGPKYKWAQIKIAGGNEKLTANVVFNAGGGVDSSVDTKLSTDDLFRKYPEFLNNAGFDKVTGDLQGEMFDALSADTSATSGFGTSTYWATVKSNMLNGFADSMCNLFNKAYGTDFSDDKLKQSLAMELIVETAESSMLTYGNDTLAEAYDIIHNTKDLSDHFFENGDTKYQLAMKLEGVTQYSRTELNDMLDWFYKKNDKGVSRWDTIDKTFNSADAIMSAGDYLMNFLTLVTVGRDCLDRLSYRLQADSSLKRGIDLLKQYYDQPLKTLMVDYASDRCMKNVKKMLTKSLTKILDTVWTHKGYTGSCYVELAEMIFKVTGTMIPGPTIEGYKQAWVSVSNTMTLRNSAMQLRNEIIQAKNNGGASNQQIGDYQLLMRTYLTCLKKSGGYVASVVRNPYVMQGHLARYDSALNYEAYISGCKSNAVYGK